MVNEYENTLRRLIILMLGEDVKAYKISEDRTLKWQEKLETASKKAKGVLSENRIIYYSDIYDIKNVITRNWESFLPILHNKKRFEIFFDEVENYRNDIAHGRALTKSQENLLSGINADLKTLITIYHNKNEMKDDFFIQLIRVTDNLGNVWEEGKSRPEVTLRVEDEYELLVEAYDPKQRNIMYEINTLSGFNISQDSNRFNFKINNILVGNPTGFYITVSTPNSTYRNLDNSIIHITILPE